MLRRARGVEANSEIAHSINWPADEQPVLVTLARIAIPFDYGLSKNAAWTMARGANYVYMKAHHKALRASIVAALRHDSTQWFNGKVWLDILIQKPSHRGDAVNMVDGICDAVKEAIDIDDNWFSIRKLDWQIVKTNPRIFIGIGQDITEHHQACSYCGKILTLQNFGKRKHGNFGRARVCLTCYRADDAVRRSIRTESL